MSDSEEQLSSLTQEQRQELLSRLLPQRKKQPPRRFPLSFAQQRLWVLDQMEGGTAAYIVPTALRLRGPLDVRLLERGFWRGGDRQRSKHRATIKDLPGFAFKLSAPLTMLFDASPKSKHAAPWRSRAF